MAIFPKIRDRKNKLPEGTPAPTQQERDAAEVTPKNSVDAADLEQSNGGTSEFEVGADGSAKIIVEDKEEIITGPQSDDKIAMLAFMEEMLTIQIDTVSEKDAAQEFDITVNGHNQHFVRGRKYTVKRYFVEGLARARPEGFKNEEYTMNDGERSVRYVSTRGLRYPFSIVRDDNPLGGMGWLQNIMMEP